ncbi:MAG: hypothetical protein JWM10_2972 [Myxococcaceae bacterium]|nr:hypothetical protein [Myxococcaceae bacterium]
MRIRLISHACVLIETDDAKILCDPWLFGKAFNDSWALYPAPAWDPALLDTVDYLWVSHEHPDHFHIPTLKSLPAAFRQRVTVLFQKNNSQKMFRAFERLGYPKHRALPHRELVRLTPTTEVYCYQEGSMNSCLVVRAGGEAVINVNDAEIRTDDCALIRRDVGRCDVVLNQFSLAGYDGRPDRERRLRATAEGILQNMVDNHRDLGARTTVPFASFVYFCVDDNRYVNEFANKPSDVARRFAREGYDLAVLPFDAVYDTRQPFDSAPALAAYDALLAGLDAQPFEVSRRVELPVIEEAFAKLCADIHDRYPDTLLAALRPVRVHVPDLGVHLEFSVARQTLRRVEAGDGDDLVVNSQPLHFAFAHPFGVQTLGVSARFRLPRAHLNWKLHRILFAMNNAEVYLRPRYLLSRDNLEFFAARLRGGAGQIAGMVRLGDD